MKSKLMMLVPIATYVMLQSASIRLTGHMPVEFRAVIWQ